MLYVVHFHAPMSPSLPAGRRDRNRQRTLAHIARVAALLFETHGYDAVTMEQIAAAADVAKGTLYNHFAVKEAVLVHWLHLAMAENLATLHEELKSKGGFAEAALHVLNHSAAWCEEHPHYLAPYLRFRFLGIGVRPSPSKQSEQLSDIVDTFLWLVRRAQASGEISDELDPVRLALSFHHLYLGAMLRWIGEPHLNLRTEFAAAVKLFLHGAAVRAPVASRRAMASPKKVP